MLELLRAWKQWNGQWDVGANSLGHMDSMDSQEANMQSHAHFLKSKPLSASFASTLGAFLPTKKKAILFMYLKI